MACPTTQVYFQHGAYIREIWAWFAIGYVRHPWKNRDLPRSAERTLTPPSSLVIFLRSAVRLRTVGWRRLALDDYIAVAVWLCFLCDSVTITLVYDLGSNLDWAERDLTKLEPCQIKQIETGSRMQLLAWYTYTALIWGLKAMMLCFFRRLTIGLFQERLVKIFSIITALCYVAVFLTITCGCFPIQKNWQVLPLPPRDQCMIKYQNFYVTTALNVGTDALVLTIPIPLLWGMRVPWGRKVALTLLLCSGVFVIAAAIMRISFTMDGASTGLNINRWGTRETIAGIIAVNAPIIQPLFKRWFWQRRWNIRNRTPSPAFPQNCDRQNRHKRHNRKSTIGTSRSRRRVRKSEIFGGDLRSLHSNENDDGISDDVVKTISLHEGRDFKSTSDERCDSQQDLEAGIRPVITVETSVDIVDSVPTPDMPAPVLVWPPDGQTHTPQTLRSSRSYGSRTEITSLSRQSTIRHSSRSSE